MPPWPLRNCSTLSMTLIRTAAHIYHGWSLGELVLSDMSFGVSLDKSVELLNLLLILACMVELYKASWLCTMSSQLGFTSTPSKLSLCSPDFTTTLGIMAMLWALMYSPTVDHSSVPHTSPTSP